MKTIKVRANCSWMGYINEGEVYTLVKQWFANGEGQYKIKDSKGITQTIPSVFFDDI